MPAIHCHSCQRQFSVPQNTGECPACGGGFVEEMPQQQQLSGSFATAGSASRGGGPMHSFSRTFTLPGGRGAVQIVTSTGGAGGAPVDPFVQGVLEAVMGGGFLHAGSPFMGVPLTIPVGGLPGGGLMPGAAGEQEWLDQLMSQIMAEYQPPSQATSQRAVRSLPALSVRPKDAQGEPGEGQAVARAGEPCSVCHDEFHEGEEVLELPCQHNYHKDCLLPWLQTHNTCPVCRFELPAEDPSVEAQRRARADAATGAGSSDAHHSRHQQQQQGTRRVSQERPGSGNRLSDLLQNISARWNSFHSSGSEDGAAAGSGSGAGGSSSIGAASTTAAGRAASEGNLGSATSASTSARAPVAGSSSSSSSGLRQRREAAAAAAERRLRGDSAASLRSRSASQARIPPHPAAQQPPAPAAAAPPEARDEGSNEGGSSDGIVAGAVAGGLLGALLGGALMLLGAAGRRRDGH